MAQRNDSKAMDETVLPILATAALNGAGIDNSQISVLLKELISTQVEKQRKETEKKERMALSALSAIADAQRAKDIQQKFCNHRKQDGSSRLCGQRLSGTGQLALVCGFCGKNFHTEPLADQEAPPRELIPSADAIGG